MSGPGRTPEIRKRMEPTLSEPTNLGGREQAINTKGASLIALNFLRLWFAVPLTSESFCHYYIKYFVTLNSPSGMPIMCGVTSFITVSILGCSRFFFKNVAVWEVSTDVSSSTSLFSAVLSVLMNSSKAFLIPVFFFFLAFPFVSSSLCLHSHLFLHVAYFFH